MKLIGIEHGSTISLSGYLFFKMGGGGNLEEDYKYEAGWHNAAHNAVTIIGEINLLAIVVYLI